MAMPGAAQCGAAQYLFSNAFHRGRKVSPVTSKTIIRSIIAFVLIVAPPCVSTAGSGAMVNRCRLLPEALLGGRRSD
jgi:hypothetical protein